uniref:Uncharacterized protein n=1 Tax=Amphimedon queenslandica TaxID=400682 RepID=A0A1X7VH08_AMPQE
MDKILLQVNSARHNSLLRLVWSITINIQRAQFSFKQSDKIGHFCRFHMSLIFLLKTKSFENCSWHLTKGIHYH